MFKCVTMNFRGGICDDEHMNDPCLVQLMDWTAIINIRIIVPKVNIFIIFICVVVVVVATATHVVDVAVCFSSSSSVLIVMLVAIDSAR